MKGPGYKLSHDVRRTWRCSACGAERKLAGDVTALVCRCRPEGTFMTIVAERTVAPRPLQVPHEHDVRSAEFGIEDMPVLLPHPSSLPPERTGPRRPRPDSSSRGVGPAAETTEATAGETAAEASPETASADQAPVPPSVTPAAEAATPEPENEKTRTGQETRPTAVEEPDDEWGAGIL